MPDDDTEQLADEGYECLWNGDFDRVLEIADRLHERRYSAYFELRGRALNQLGRRDEAIKTLREGTEVAPAADRNWHWLGTLLSDARRYEEALEAFDGELEHGGSPSAVALNKAIVYSRMSLPQKAIMLLAELPEVPAEQQAFLAYRSLCLLDLGQFAEADADARAAMTLYEQHADDDAPATDAMHGLAWLTRCKVLFETGQREEAEAAVLGLVRWDSSDFRACRLLREVRGKSLDGVRCWCVHVFGTPVDDGTTASEPLVACYYVNAATPADALESVREVETVLDGPSLELAQLEDVTDDEDRPHYPFAGVVCRAKPYEKVERDEEPDEAAR